MARGDTSGIWQAILFGVTICTAIAHSNLSRSVHVEVGFHQYAELVDPTTLLKMPFNAIVNIGYIIIGFFWLMKVRNTTLSNDALYFFDMFSLMSVTYGPVQFFRITTQQRLFAILDQWFTLPIFAWAALFGIFTITQKRQPAFQALILLASVASYGLAFINQQGFEVALGIHIFAAILIGTYCQLYSGSQNSLKYLIFAILCCFGFVVLKLYDHHLSKRHWFFKRISGHFLSKICDILQIHFVAEFFLELLVKKTKRS